jgi:hypothetical protein
LAQLAKDIAITAATNSPAVLAEKNIEAALPEYPFIAFMLVFLI